MAQLSIHDIRIADLPPQLADQACGRASQLIQLPDVVCVVTPEPTQAWHVTPTKAVELRAVGRGAQS